MNLWMKRRRRILTPKRAKNCDRMTFGVRPKICSWLSRQELGSWKKATDPRPVNREDDVTGSSSLS